jgi:hypothetical protein
VAAAEQRAFDGVARTVRRLNGQRRYSEALALARDASGRFTDRRATTSFWIACLLSVMGEHDDAENSPLRLRQCSETPPERLSHSLSRHG